MAWASAMDDSGGLSQESPELKKHNQPNMKEVPDEKGLFIKGYALFLFKGNSSHMSDSHWGLKLE